MFWHCYFVCTWLGIIDNTVNAGDDIPLGDDLNFQGDETHNGFKHCKHAFDHFYAFLIAMIYA